MKKLYRVELSDDQRQELKDLIATGSLPNAANSHARILLKADAAKGGHAWTDEQISDAFDISVRTVVRVRQAFCKGGLKRAVNRQERSGTPRRKIDGVAEAHLIALVCSPAPEGYTRWTLRLLADRWVEISDLDSVCPESVRQTLKKTNLSLG
jgi:hypothetical protein